MMTTKNFHRLVDFLAEIYHLQNTVQLIQTIMRRLPDLVSCENVMVGRHNADQRMMTGIALREPFSRQHFLPEANETGLLGTHPFWDRILDSAEPLKVLSEMRSSLRWKENPFYQEILRHDKVRDHLNVEFGESRTSFTSVSVIRSSIGFNEKEKIAMTFIRSHLARAFENASLFDTARFPNQSEQSFSNFIVIHLSLRGQCLRQRDQKLFDALIKGASSSASMQLKHWINRCIDALNRGRCQKTYLQTRAKIKKTNYELKLEHDWVGNCYRLEWRQVFVEDELSGRPLSLRESEVLWWIRRGKTNREIAEILRISNETVKTNVKRIFRKLGVENRTAAAATPPSA